MSSSHRRRGSVVLLSGGMDSATCLAVAAERSRPVHALTVLYGQRHAREVRAARRLARHFGAMRHTVIELPVGPILSSALTRPRSRLPTGRRGRRAIPATYVPARNTILLALALGYAESHRLGTIYLGVNAIDYSGYPDCRPEFLRAFERVARVGTRAGIEGSPVRLAAPLLRRSKASIVRLGERYGVPWGLTYSCYAGGPVPCGACDACRLRAQGFREADVIDPTAPTTPPASRARRVRAAPA